jgi:uncharacterized repeat protein (TIGR03803 family)
MRRRRTPRSRLVQGTDENFHGTAIGGGDNGDGMVFKITPICVRYPKGLRPWKNRSSSPTSRLDVYSPPPGMPKWKG